MKTQRSLNKVAFFGLVLASAFASLTLWQSPQSQAAEPSKQPDAMAPAASAKHDKDSYIVEIKSSSTAKAGQDSSVEITIEAKGDYHINAKYPLKFKVKDPAPAGVSFAKAVIKREDGKFEDKKGSLPVSFRAEKSGKTTIEGTLSFSVCSDANCVMDKIELAVDVDVK